jgi:hypothetical protein
MKNNIIVPLVLVLAVVALAAVVLALTGDFGKHSGPSPAPAPIVESRVSQPKPSVQYAPLGGDAPSADEATTAAGAPLIPDDPFMTGAEPGSPNQAALEQIIQGKVTYSAEGVPLIQPFLNNPDEEIRMEAIEAMKQLDAPEAAAALRAAARNARNAQDRAAMLEAAEFVELPSLMDLIEQQRQQQQPQ